MKKKIMILGGSNFQIPAILRAKELGLHVITCDYLPENPGHQYADQYVNESTIDKLAVLAVAKKLNIDAIITLSSDPAIPTVAYVAEHMNLPGPPQEAVTVLSEKNLFRALLKKAGLPAPKYFVLDSEKIPEEVEQADFRYVVKPVDSCGSKGITFSPENHDALVTAVRTALNHSRSNKCIIEEYIDGDQAHGDGYLVNGKLIYQYLGDHVFYTKTRNFIPISTRWPCRHSVPVLEDIAAQVEKASQAAGYLDGPVNIEARITSAGNYIVEIAPRNGGNFVPIIQQHLTGFNFVDRIIHDALGMDCPLPKRQPKKKVGAYYILHAQKHGIFQGVSISPAIKNNIFFYTIFKQKGDAVTEYVGSHTTIGVALLEFESVSERDQRMGEINSLIKVEIS
jgi:biotin carboxylase